MNEIALERLQDALELHLHILFSEKQAIVARDLDTIEDILSQKDKSLALLIEAKNEFTGRYTSQIQSSITSVLSLQEDNAKCFRKLHIQEKNPPIPAEGQNPLFRRFKKAYFN